MGSCGKRPIWQFSCEPEIGRSSEGTDVFTSEGVVQHRSWLRFPAFGTRLAFGVLLAIAVFVVGGTVISAIHRRAEPRVADLGKDAGARPLNPTEHSHPVSTETFSGVITDDHCAARHDMNSGQSPAECTRACLRRGAKYILVNGDRSYRLEGNPDQLDKFTGTRVNLTGSRKGDRIQVSSIAWE